MLILRGLTHSNKVFLEWMSLTHFPAADRNFQKNTFFLNSFHIFGHTVHSCLLPQELFHLFEEAELFPTMLILAIEYNSCVQVLNGGMK